MNIVRVTVDNGALVIQTPYSQGFVNAIKTIPAADRMYNPDDKTWSVSLKHTKQIEAWIQQFYGTTFTFSQVYTQPTPELKVLNVLYIGATKDRGDNQRTALGHNGTTWAYMFPENVLRQWFEGISFTNYPTSAITLYGILGISQIATPEEIKTAYRRLAKQWHPDICKEDDAEKQFRKISNAYEILSSDKRGRYDAGLMLEATLGKDNPRNNQDSYRSPLRCGYVLAEGYQSVGKFVVNKIVMWEDITNDNGQTLVTSWPMGAKIYKRIWA